MSIDIQEIREELENISEEKYKKFASSLIPGVDNLLGVRIPILQKMAKQIVKENPGAYLDKAEDKYFEEVMLQGLVIGHLKDDIDIVLARTKDFVPKINNWSICDSFCSSMKIAKKNPECLWTFIEPYWKSDKTYDIRFAVVMMNFHFVNEEYLERLFMVFNHIKLEQYYVKMAVAWAVSTCFVKFPDKTMLYLKSNKLDDETYNKSLQKIRESLKVDKDMKAVIKTMKRL